MTDKAFHMRVTFLGDGLSQEERCALLMELERTAITKTGRPMRVFLDRMGDDSKLRVAMTEEERAKL